MWARREGAPEEGVGRSEGEREVCCPLWGRVLTGLLL